MKVKHTKLLIAVEWISLSLIAALLCWLYFHWSSFPEKIPMHYNFAGNIDRWGTKSNLLLMPSLLILLYLLLTIVSFFPNIWNIPVRKTQQNQEALYRSTKTLLVWMKLELVIFLSYLTMHTSTAQPLSPIFLLLFLGILFGSLLLYFVRIFQIGRHPSSF